LPEKLGEEIKTIIRNERVSVSHFIARSLEEAPYGKIRKESMPRKY